MNVSTPQACAIQSQLQISHPSMNLKKSNSNDNDDDYSLIVDFPKRGRRSSMSGVTFSKNSSLRHFEVDVQSAELWYSKDEYKLFRRNLKYDVKAARCQHGSAANKDSSSYGINTTHHETCLAGIENFLCQDTFKELLDARKMHRHAIFEEQERQEIFGVPNLHALRAVSMAHSEWDKTRALSRGACKERRVTV